MLVDKRIFSGGLALLAVGLALTLSLAATVPAGQAGMTEDEILDFMMEQQENEDYTTLSGILIGVGFLLVLISFGARRRGGAKKTQKIVK